MVSTFYYLENNHNNTLQFRPSIPRRPSLSRFPATHNLLVTSQVHDHQEQPLKRPIETEIDNDEGIDSAIESRSLSINTPDDGILEVNKIKDFLNYYLKLNPLER
jgi:hypothetical protein